MTIWKFTLAVTDRQSVVMPRDARVLSVGAQDDPTGATVQLWAEVDPTADREQRYFAIVGTGNPRPRDPDAPTSRPGGSFLGTVITAGGALVWHVYEVPR